MFRGDFFPPRKFAPSGAIAQLGERLLCKQEVVGSIPSGSTSLDLEADFLDNPAF